MLDERTIYLIHAGIDGELKPAEREELEAALEASSEARAMNAEFQRLGNLLDSVPSEQPPPDLASKILKNTSLPSRKSPFSLTSFFASFQPAAAGVAFAAGLLAAITFYELSPIPAGSENIASMVGTMVSNPGGQKAVVLDRLVIDQPDLQGTVSLHSEASVLMLNFELITSEQVEIEVSFANAGLGFGGMAKSKFNDALDTESFEVADGTLRVTDQGTNMHVFLLRRPQESELSAKAIDIEVNRAGEILFQGALRIEKDSG